MTVLTIEERVAAGAAWLDENRPGWWQRTDLATLDIGSTCDCVLGQEYGHYGRAPDAARFAGGQLVAGDRGFDGTHLALTAEWRRLIEQRRAAVS